MENLKIVAAQTSWQLLGKAVSAISTSLIIFLIARFYKEYGTGVFTLVITYLGFFYLAIDFGANAHYLHYLVDPKKVESYFRKLLGFRLFLAAALILIANFTLILLGFNSPEFNTAAIIGSLSFIPSALYITTNAMFQAKLKYNLSIVASSLSFLVATVIIIFLIMIKTPIQYLIIAQVLGWWVCGLTALFLVHPFIKSLFPIFDYQFGKQLILHTWPIAGTLLVNLIYFRVDAFMLERLKGFSEVGIYNLAYLFFQSALVLPTFITNSYYPLMLKNLRTGLNIFLNESISAVFILLGLGVLGSILVYITSPILITLLSLVIGSPSFQQSIDTLKVLSLGFPAYFLSALLMLMLISLRQYTYLFFIYLVSLLINISLNIILIPQLSYLGAAITTAFVEYVVLVLLAVTLVLKFRKVNRISRNKNKKS